jgi:hypothetical protein
MDSFWCNVFGYFKERRAAAIFYSTFVILAVLAGVGFVLYQVVCAYDLQGYMGYAGAFAGLAFLVWVARAFNAARARARWRYKSSPLSRDELNKARSKLLKAR